MREQRALKGPRRPADTVVAVLGCALVFCFSAVMALQILVWNPAAAAAAADPARTGLGSAGGGLDFATPLIASGVGVALGLALLVLTLVGVLRRAVVAIAYLGALVLGYPVYLLASFGNGVHLADEYGVSGGDHALGGLVLGVISAAALIVLLVLTVRRSARRPHVRAA
ncbi:MAG: hypothetical protein LBE60_18255 [Microbacterium sp.]|jgi:hypothetical protein|uniref:hypothetical protein n=1 Tax=Microbacterium sp. TaxID=51671 RepID=UPI002826DF6F|nr:hypothetical protein [Microbacterium sp.]MDR2323577.1 hypothetical protein [Microbacterium sp.]